MLQFKSAWETVERTLFAFRRSTGTTPMTLPSVCRLQPPVKTPGLRPRKPLNGYVVRWGARDESSGAELTAAHDSVGSAQFLLTAACFKVSSHKPAPKQEHAYSMWCYQVFGILMEPFFCSHKLCVVAVLFCQIRVQLLLALDQWLMLSFHCTSQMCLELCTLLSSSLLQRVTWIEATWPELISIYWCLFRDGFILPSDSRNHQM